MPDSSNSPGNPPETAQASLLRLTRRHSLPASTTFSTFLSLWSAENANRENRERSNSSTANDVHPGIANNTSSNNRHHRSASISGDTLLNGSSNGNGALGGNRHRYGHRHTRSAVVDTPVIVKSYNPGPAVSRNASPLHEVCLSSLLPSRLVSPLPPPTGSHITPSLRPHYRRVCIPTTHEPHH